MPFDAGRVFFGLVGFRCERHADQADVVLPQRHRQARTQEDHLAPARLSRRHGRERQPHGTAGVPQTLRSADHRASCTPMRRTITAKANPVRAQAAFVDRIVGNLEALIKAEGSGHDRGVHRRTGHGCRRCRRTAGRLLREGAGGARPLRHLLHRRRSDLRIRPHRQPVRRADIRHPSDHDEHRESGIDARICRCRPSSIPEFLYEPFIEASGQVGTFGHGFTYSGHPVCAAVALRNLELMEERDLFDHAARMSKPFQARLRALGDHPLVGEARGVGMIGAVELVANKSTKAPFDSKRGVAAYCSGARRGTRADRAQHRRDDRDLSAAGDQRKPDARTLRQVRSRARRHARMDSPGVMDGP